MELRKKYSLIFILTLLCTCNLLGQNDTVYIYPVIHLDSVVIADTKNGFDVNEFIWMVENDTTFYQSFRNLRKVNYSTTANIRMFDKRGLTKASLYNKSVQKVSGKCRWMETFYQTVNGDFFDKKGEMNYYTAKMFSYIFLYTDTICSGTGTEIISDRKASQLEKRKEQLKVLVFNPGKPVEGIPFVNSKLSIFDEEMMQYYDYAISARRSDNGIACYLFTIRLKEEADAGDVVLQEMNTWFNKADFSIIARDYKLSTDNMVFDFDVSMRVRMIQLEDKMVPGTIQYNGTWNVPGKKRETGSVFIDITQ